MTGHDPSISLRARLTALSSLRDTTQRTLRGLPSFAGDPSPIICDMQAVSLISVWIERPTSSLRLPQHP